MSGYITNTTYTFRCPICGQEFSGTTPFAKHTEGCNPDHNAWLDSLVGKTYTNCSMLSPEAGIILGIDSNGWLDVIRAKSSEFKFGHSESRIFVERASINPYSARVMDWDGVCGDFVRSCRSYFSGRLREISPSLVPSRKPGNVGSPNGVTPDVVPHVEYICKGCGRSFESEKDFDDHDCVPNFNSLAGRVVLRSGIVSRYGVIRARLEGNYLVTVVPNQSRIGFSLDTKLEPFSLPMGRAISMVPVEEAYDSLMQDVTRNAERLLDLVQKAAESGWEAIA